MNRSANWLFTWFKKEDTEAKFLTWDEDDLVSNGVRFIVYQLEECPETGKPHYQGYIEMVVKIRFKALTKLFPSGIHLELRKGTQRQAIAYCTKEDTRIAIGARVGQPKKHRQGARTDLIAFHKAICLEGKTDLELFHDFPRLTTNHLRVVDRLRSEFMRNRAKRLQDDPQEPTVIILHGDTGMGKTRYIWDRHKFDEVYQVEFGTGTNSSLWFDDYRGEDILLIDDFFGNMRLTLLLRILDWYARRVQNKGGYTYIRFKLIYITSNKAPQDWYTNVPYKSQEALQRRFSKIIEFKRLEEKMTDFNQCH